MGLRSWDILRGAAEVNEAKNREYGSGYQNHGDVVQALFPDGVTLHGATDHARFALLTLVIVKLVRYCRRFNDGHGDSLTDMAVYAAMLREMDDARLSDRSLARPGLDIEEAFGGTRSHSNGYAGGGDRERKVEDR